MKRILENLNDPSWWFTAVLVAIIAGIASAYLKDLVGGLLSLISSRVARWNRREKHKQWRRAIRNVSDLHVLILETARIITLIIFTSFLQVSILFYFTHRKLDEIKTSTNLENKTANILMMVLTLATSFGVTRGSAEFLRLRRAYHHLQAKRNIRKIQRQSKK